MSQSSVYLLNPERFGNFPKIRKYSMHPSEKTSEEIVPSDFITTSGDKNEEY
jgi:hypothetical protein